MRSAPIAASLLATALLATACGSSGTHTQTPGPTAASSDGPTTTSTAGPSTSTSKPLPRASTKPIPTPTVTPPAQAAVNSYVSFLNVSTAADRDPAHADVAGLSKYATGQALTAIRDSINNMKAQGLAYRGTAPDPNVKIVVIGSATAVVLSSCPQQSSTDPFIQFNLATGKAVPVAKRNPPPPYLRVLTMRLVGGSWKLANIATNASKTCTP